MFCFFDDLSRKLYPGSCKGEDESLLDVVVALISEDSYDSRDSLVFESDRVETRRWIGSWSGESGISRLSITYLESSVFVDDFEVGLSFFLDFSRDEYLSTPRYESDNLDFCEA